MDLSLLGITPEIEILATPGLGLKASYLYVHLIIPIPILPDYLDGFPTHQAPKEALLGEMRVWVVLVVLRCRAQQYVL